MKPNRMLNSTRLMGEGVGKSEINPTRTALAVALVYIVVIALYIWISGRVAANYAVTIERLENIELVKGLVFVVFSGAALFIGVLMLLRRIEKKTDIIISQNRSLISSERLVMAGIFSSSVCHDINNIMFSIIGNAEFLRTSARLEAGDREFVDQILSASRSLTSLTHRMMTTGHGYIPGEKAPADISQIVRETIEFAKVHKKIKACRLDYDLPAALVVDLNTPLFSRALMNMILNAAESSDQAVDILVKLIENHDDHTVALEVHDSGSGIADEIKEKIFEPFFTSKANGNGLGLLSLKTCAEQHAGHIELKRSELGGTCFRLTIPGNLDGGPPGKGRIQSAEAVTG